VAGRVARFTWRRAGSRPTSATCRGARDSGPRRPSPPPGRRIATERERVPDLEHPMAGCLSLGQDDPPRLPAHRGPELLVERVDVELRAAGTCRPGSAGAGPRPRPPCAEVGDQVGHRPVRVALVAGWAISAGSSESTRRSTSPIRSARPRSSDRTGGRWVHAVPTRSGSNAPGRWAWPWRQPQVDAGWRCDTYPPRVAGSRRPAGSSR